MKFFASGSLLRRHSYIEVPGAQVDGPGRPVASRNSAMACSSPARIANSKAKSVGLTDKGKAQSEELFQKLFGKGK